MPITAGSLAKGQVINGYVRPGDADDTEVGLIPVGGTDGANRREMSVNASGEVDVNLASALPAGTNNIGDVDVLTLPISFNSGAADPTTQRMILASDDPAVVLLGTIDADTSGLFGTVNTDGAAAGTTAIAIAGTDGANAQILSTDTSGRLNTNTIVNPAEETPVFATVGSLSTITFTDINTFSPGADTAITQLHLYADKEVEFRVEYGTTASEVEIARYQNSGSNLNIIVPMRLDITTAQTIIVSAQAAKANTTGYVTVWHE